MFEWVMLDRPEGIDFMWRMATVGSTAAQSMETPRAALPFIASARLAHEQYGELGRDGWMREGRWLR